MIYQSTLSIFVQSKGPSVPSECLLCTQPVWKVGHVPHGASATVYECLCVAWLVNMSGDCQMRSVLEVCILLTLLMFETSQCIAVTLKCVSIFGKFRNLDSGSNTVLDNCCVKQIWQCIGRLSTTPISIKWGTTWVQNDVTFYVCQITRVPLNYCMKLTRISETLRKFIIVQWG